MHRNGFRLAFQFLCWEAVFAIAYETWTGPTYLSGIAGELGVNMSLVGLLAAVPWIGSIGQLFAVWIFAGSSSIRVLTLRLAGAARILWAIPVLFAWLWGFRSYHEGQPFPANRWFTLTFCVACASALLSSSGGVSWLAWTRELVPGRIRGRFFGARQRYTMAAVIVAHALGYFWVSWKPGGYHLGYGIMLLCALFGAAMSTLFLSKVPDVEATAPIAPAARGWLETIREPFEDPVFRPVIIFGACFNGAIQLAGPYFPYYFTRELHIPMSTIAYWTILTNLGWLIAAMAWGRCADRARKLGPAFTAAIFMVAISPAYYVIPSAAWVRFIGPFDYFTNGIAWGGYALLLTTLQLRNSRPGRTAIYCSVYSATAGFAGAVATLLGAKIAVLLQPWGGFRALCWIAVTARLGVVLLLSPMLSAAVGGEAVTSLVEEDPASETSLREPA